MSDAQGQRVEWDTFFRFVRNVLSRLFKTLFVERELSESIKEGRKAQSQKGSWYPEESGWACKSLAFKGMQKYACGKLEDVVFTLKVVPMIVRILWLYYVREFSSIHFFLNVQVPKNFVSLKSGLYRIDIAESLTKEWEWGSFTPYSELTFDNNKLSLKCF